MAFEGGDGVRACMRACKRGLVAGWARACVVLVVGRWVPVHSMTRPIRRDLKERAAASAGSELRGRRCEGRVTRRTIS